MWQHAGSGGRVSPGPSEAADSAVRDLVQDFATHFNTGVYEQCAQIFLPEGQLMFPHHDVTHGQSSIERTLRAMADAGYQDLRLETVRVDAAADRAIEIGRYTVSLRLGTGKTVTDRGNYLASWHRLGAWRIAANCFSSSVPRSWQDMQERHLRAV